MILSLRIHYCCAFASHHSVCLLFDRRGVWALYALRALLCTSQNLIFREAKFKRALRVHFLTHFTKNFFRFITPKVKSGTDMINPSIESSDFLFWHKKILSWILENFVENRQTKFHILKFRVCVNTH